MAASSAAREQNAAVADDAIDAAFDTVFDAARLELYAADYDDFTPTRVGLASAAKKAGAADVAKRITALRKPTRAAWTLNRLARSAGADLAELFELGDALRGAQTSLDGPALRALSVQRRQVVDALVDQALRTTGQAGAAEGLRAELRSTLEAAMVDLDVRAELRAGVLVRAAQFIGFGGSALSLVPDQSPRTASPNPTPRTQKPTTPPLRTPTPAIPAQADDHPGSDAPRKPTRAQAAAQARADRAEEAASRRLEAQRERERRERQQADLRRTAAREAVAAADTVLSQAVEIEKQSSRRVRLVQEQLADARRRLDDARLDVRRARSEQAKAVKALRELQ